MSRDISFASLTQYDNVGLSLRASETSVAISSFPVIASKSQDLRGKTRQSRSFFSNLSKIASDLQNVQLAIKWDCHANASAFARNDGTIAFVVMTYKTRYCHDSSLFLKKLRFACFGKSLESRNDNQAIVILRAF